ncbi:MAG: ribonuclease P protein component [Candidatus Melainabacteria bacterium]|nr:ribonuclease P protein component [Candidatus Melainabacteria bacterium]
MLSRPYRLRSDRLFKRTLHGERLCANSFFAVFVLYHLPNYRASHRGSPRANTPPSPRFGFVVSRKIHKRAVRRNRIKRRLREWVRTQLLPAHAPALSQVAALVVVARPGSLHASYQAMGEALNRCTQRLRPLPLQPVGRATPPVEREC